MTSSGNLSDPASAKFIMIVAACTAVAIALWTCRLMSVSRSQAAPPLPSHVYPILTHAQLDPSSVHFVAVGDSYTYCVGAPEAQAWPTLLAQHLAVHGVKIQLAGNLGIDGITSAGALHQEMSVYDELQPTFATLMIGVNDTYNPVTTRQFRINLGALLDKMQSDLPDKSRLIVITIPDMSASPRGAVYARMNNAAAKLLQFNSIIRGEAQKRGLPVVDVFAITQKMRGDPTLIAPDFLHPSAKEYAIWEKAILPVALKMLKHPSRYP